LGFSSVGAKILLKLIRFEPILLIFCKIEAKVGQIWLDLGKIEANSGKSVQIWAIWLDLSKI